MALKDYSTTASDNASVGSVNFAEGQAPSTVNNSARQLMADIKGGAVVGVDNHTALIALDGGALSDGVMVFNRASGNILVWDSSATYGVGLTDGTTGKFKPVSDWLSPKDFGADGDGDADDTTALSDCGTACDGLNIWMDVQEPSNYYKISADIELPRLVRLGFRSISGEKTIKGTGFKVKFSNKKYGSLIGGRFEDLLIDGIYFSKVEVSQADTLTIGGYNETTGTSWNTITCYAASQLKIDLSSGYVNFNKIFCNAKDNNTVYGLEITDGTNEGPTYYECHGNEIWGDFSGSLGVRNISNKNQINHINGLYLENSAAFTGGGNFSVNNMTFDGSSMPGVDRFAHILNATRHVERTGADVLSMSVVNLAEGGDWTALDTNGKPPCFSGSTVSVTADAAMPGNTGAKYGKSTATDFQNVKVTLQACETGYFVMTGYWAGDLPASISVNRGSGDTTAIGTGGFVELATGYYFFRLTATCNTSSTTTVEFYITGNAGDTREGYLGAVWVSPYKAGVIPWRPTLSGTVVSAEVNGLHIQHGSVTRAYTSSSPVDVTITFPETFAAAPIVTATVKPASTYEDKYEKHMITAVSTTSATIRIYFSTDFTGDIHWQATR